MLDLLVPLWLTVGPAEQYPEAVTQLDSAVEAVGNGDAQESIRALNTALKAIAEYPEDLPGDADTLIQLGNARLSLVWLHISEGNEDLARQVMDEALRSARGTALPAGTYGPKVLRLYEDRLAALRESGTATIEVDCRIPCQVVVNERRSANPTDPLYLGDYRVWVGARDGSVEWAYYEVSLDAPGETEIIVYQAAAAGVSPPGPDLVPSEERQGSTTAQAKGTPPTKKRMLPRWAEIVSMTAGAGLAISGAVLLALDGTCRGGGDPADPASCPFTWDNKPQGPVLLGVGLGVFALSGVFLTIDEVRVGRDKGKQAMVSWTFRF